MDVSLFVTCLNDTYYPRTGIAVVKVLERLGCRVDFPAGQTCCGQPMYNNGFHDQARELAKRMVQVFEQSRYVVTPSGSCAAMIHDYYPQLFAGDHAWEPGIRSLVDKTYEFTRFLVEVLKVDLRAQGCQWPGKATYHYSCHLRGIGAGSPPVEGTPSIQPDYVGKLLGQIDGLEYIPLEKAEQCCGFGGMFAVKMPEISGAMVRDKVQCIKKTGAPVVISNEGGCTMNIAGACHRQNVPVRFMSLAEIIAQGLGVMP